MEVPVIDLSYLYEVSGNDPKYIYDIIGLFLDNVPTQLSRLEELVRGNAEWLPIQKQAHSLKSSVLFVKIRGLYDGFYGIEMLARQNTGREQMIEKLDQIVATYAEALPLLLAEKSKCEQLSKQ